MSLARRSFARGTALYGRRQGWLSRADGSAELAETYRLEHDRDDENGDDDAERHDRVGAVERDREDESDRGGRDALPRDPADDAKPSERDRSEEERDAEPERPPARLRQRVER